MVTFEDLIAIKSWEAQNPQLPNELDIEYFNRELEAFNAEPIQMPKLTPEEMGWTRIHLSDDDMKQVMKLRDSKP